MRMGRPVVGGEIMVSPTVPPCCTAARPPFTVEVGNPPLGIVLGRFEGRGGMLRAWQPRQHWERKDDALDTKSSRSAVRPRAPDRLRGGVRRPGRARAAQTLRLHEGGLLEASAGR